MEDLDLYKHAHVTMIRVLNSILHLNSYLINFLQIFDDKKEALKALRNIIDSMHEATDELVSLRLRVQSHINGVDERQQEFIFEEKEEKVKKEDPWNPKGCITDD